MQLGAPMTRCPFGNVLSKQLVDIIAASAQSEFRSLYDKANGIQDPHERFRFSWANNCYDNYNKLVLFFDFVHADSVAKAGLITHSRLIQELNTQLNIGGEQHSQYLGVVAEKACQSYTTCQEVAASRNTELQEKHVIRRYPKLREQQERNKVAVTCFSAVTRCFMRLRRIWALCAAE